MSIDEDVLAFGRANRVRPSAEVDGGKPPLRTTRYGDLVTTPYDDALVVADEGHFYQAINATPGTGIAGHAAPTDISLVTKPHVWFKNARATSSNVRCYIRQIVLRVTVAGAGATDLLWALEGEASDTTRRTSGGTQLTGRNPNMDSSEVPGDATVLIYAGAVVAAAAGANARELGSGLVRTVVPVVGDTYVFDFTGKMSPSGNILSGTAPAQVVVTCPPVILGAQQQLLLHLAGTSQSGAHSYEVDVRWHER